MKHASLFSGIGGFDLAAQWMGWENVFQVEIDKFCQKVLEKNFPNVTRYGDIKEFDGTRYRGTIDVLSGGFPCQPFSAAGKRKGTEDDRHLWPQMLRVIGEVQPRWVVGENVSGLLNWSGGLVLKQIKADLENTGYTLLPPAILPACGKNAPHRRDRIWIVAHSESLSCIDGLRYEGHPSQEIPEERYHESDFATNSNSQGLEIRELEHNGKEHQASVGSDNQWKDWPTKPGICGRDDGIPNRVDRIKSLGNAIVPQVAYEIFKAIELTVK